MKTVAFIDAGQYRLPIVGQRLDLSSDEKFDWEKFNDFMVEISEGTLRDVHYFDARSDNEDSRAGFHQFLKNRLGYQLHFTWLREKRRCCSNCGHEVVDHEQKGVNVKLATKMLHLAHNRSFDRAILCSGDGDFASIVRDIRNSFAQQVIVLSWSGSIAPSLRDAANSVMTLENYKDKFVNFDDDEPMDEDLPPTLKK